MTEIEQTEMRDDVKAMKIALLGYNGEHGQPGLCSQVASLVEDYLKHKRNTCIVFGILVGSGALGMIAQNVWL